ELKIKPDALAADLKGISIPDARANLEMLGNKQSDSYLRSPLMDVARFLANQGKIDTIPDMEQFLEPKFVKAALET
ncbi:MAG: myristoyl transferase, partial [Moorea sp. SIO2C4]|nr:myristoyl transferase [Moorena sp. SIO2C4]